MTANLVEEDMRNLKRARLGQLNQPGFSPMKNPKKGIRYKFTLVLPTKLGNILYYFYYKISNLYFNLNRD